MQDTVERESSGGQRGTSKRRSVPWLIGGILLLGILIALVVPVLLAMRIEWKPYRLTQKSASGDVTEIAFAAPKTWHYEVSKVSIYEGRGGGEGRMATLKEPDKSASTPGYIRWIEEKLLGKKANSDRATAEVRIWINSINSSDPALPSHLFRESNNLFNSMRFSKLSRNLMMTWEEHNTLNVLPDPPDTHKFVSWPSTSRNNQGAPVAKGGEDAFNTPIWYFSEMKYDQRYDPRRVYSLSVYRKHLAQRGTPSHPATYRYEYIIMNAFVSDSEYSNPRSMIDAIVQSLHFID